MVTNYASLCRTVVEISIQSQEPGKLVTTTIRDYDLSETSKLVSSLNKRRESLPSFTATLGIYGHRYDGVSAWLP